MNWTPNPATESQQAANQPLDKELEYPLRSSDGSPPINEPHAHPPGTGPNPAGGPQDMAGSTPACHEITVGKRRILNLRGKEIEVFTMSLGEETIELLPLKNWGQLDVHKWTVRGRLPGTPAGIEVTEDHVKLIGETVSPAHPGGCARLEKLFEEWLALEKEGLELARKKAQRRKTISAVPESPPAPGQHHFQVDVDKEGQVHVRCLEGKEELAMIGLNLPGFNSLVTQGWMRKPHALKVGALHDWVELDGVLYSFEKGNNDAAKLTEALNNNYRPPVALGQGKDIVVYANAASSTGFDIQFPARVAGVPDHRRRPLAEESLELLQDPTHCGLLQPGLVIKLTRPTLIFKQKTPDGGEQYLDASPENVVRVSDEDGDLKLIDLSRPVNYLHLGPIELTAVFNHPSINRHAKAGPPEPQPQQIQKAPESPPPPAPPAPTVSPPGQETISLKPGPLSPTARPPRRPVAEAQATAGEARMRSAAPERSSIAARPALPNRWLKPILAQQQVRDPWFDFLVYGKIAEKFGNSFEGTFQGGPCWFIGMGEVDDIQNPEFKGMFLAEQSGLGFLHQGHLVRFHKGNMFLGTLKAAPEAQNVDLIAVGLDAIWRLLFIVSDEFRSRFNMPAQALEAELDHLKEGGAWILNVKEVLEYPHPLGVVWSVPVDQENPAEPKAFEYTRPAEVMKA